MKSKKITKWKSILITLLLLLGAAVYFLWSKEEAKKLKKLEFLGGIADGQALSADGAKAYADLPSREELIAKFVFVAASPLSGIAQVTAGPARALATALSAVADQKNAA